MTEQQMPARIWADRLLCCGTRADKADSDDTAYIRADIAERMAEALEKIAGSHFERIGHCQTDVEDAPDLTAEDAMLEARSALSDFRSATQDTEARHD